MTIVRMQVELDEACGHGVLGQCDACDAERKADRLDTLRQRAIEARADEARERLWR